MLCLENVAKHLRSYSKSYIFDDLIISCLLGGDCIYTLLRKSCNCLNHSLSLKMGYIGPLSFVTFHKESE